MLKRSALCITHAGLNTTLEALTQGVPLVAIPVTNDQPGVAARIAYTKTGTFVPLKELTVPRLTLLIDRVLRNPEYRENANRLRQAIANTNGLEKAVDPVQLRSVASQLEAGTVWINQHAIRNPFVPASAYKDSGLGVEYGQEGLEEFCNMRVIAERAGKSISS